MDKSQKAALFVFASLLVTLITGLVLYGVYSGRFETAVPLLVGCVLAAFLLIIVTARLVTRFRKSQLLSETHQVPPGRVLHALSLRQWLILMVGATVIAVSTGALTGVRVLAADAPAPISGPTTGPTTTAPTTPAVVTTAPTPSPTPTPSDSPSPSASPSESLSGSPDPSSTGPTPEKGSIKYLDSEPVLAGRADDSAVTFSAARYPRGLKLYCSTATSTFVQWNVAGNASFEAVAGIDDNTQNAFGAVIELLFYDQDGHQLVPKAVEASVGHPQPITLNLTGVVSLLMTCSGRDVKTNKQRSTTASLGDPKIIRA